MTRWVALMMCTAAAARLAEEPAPVLTILKRFLLNILLSELHSPDTQTTDIQSKDFKKKSYGLPKTINMLDNCMV